MKNCVKLFNASVEVNVFGLNLPSRFELDVNTFDTLEPHEIVDKVCEVTAQVSDVSMNVHDITKVHTSPKTVPLLLTIHSIPHSFRCVYVPCWLNCFPNLTEHQNTRPTALSRLAVLHRTTSNAPRTSTTWRR